MLGGSVASLRSARAQRFVLCAGLSLASWCAFAVPANAAAPEDKRVNYDPSTCKTDAHGKLYIALGRNVLALPSSGTVIIAQRGNNWLPPPDPTEPVGCPSNPEQLTGYGFPYAYNAATGKRSSAFPRSNSRADLLQLIRASGDASVPIVDDKQWGRENFELQLAQSICSGEKVRKEASQGWSVIREELSNGFLACRLKHGSLEKREEDMRTSYIARSAIYQTPLGRPFVVNCSDQLYSLPVGHCDVNYVFRPGLAVSYEFQPYRGPRALPISQVIEFDRGVREKINSALIKNYAWPGDAPTSPN